MQRMRQRGCISTMFGHVGIQVRVPLELQQAEVVGRGQTRAMRQE